MVELEQYSKMELEEGGNKYKIDDDKQKSEKRRKTRKKIKCYKVCQKVIYIFCLLTLIGLCLIQTIQCFVKFMGEPTYMSSEILPQNQAEFPAMTVCPETKGYKEEVLQENGIPKVARYNFKWNLNWTSSNSSWTEADLFEAATYQIDELIKKVYIRFFKENPLTEKSNEELILDISNPSIQEQRHRNFGKCYTIHPAEYIRKLGVYYIKAEFFEDVKIYFHAPGQFLDLSGRMGYKVYTGETMQTQLNFHDIRMMSKDLDDGKKSCINSVYDECMYDALVKHMLAKTGSEGGCTVPWIMDNGVGTTRICKTAENINITFWEVWNRGTNQKSDCPNPCETLLVTLGAKNLQTSYTQETGLIYLYFAPRTMFSEDHELYTILSLFAEIGGYVGLLLGVSLWHFAEWGAGLLETKIKSLENETEDM